jgi:uncharacterized protein YdaU (DUF1376 family)
VSELLAPLTTVDHNIEGYDGFLLNVQKLMASELWALSSGDEFKAAVGLWCRAWTQKPHGSLPDDNRILAGFSGAGSKWNKVKDMALRGFVKCSDGRLYHETLCDDVVRASEAKSARIKRTEAATQARQKQRNDERDVVPKDNVTTTKIILNLNERKKEDGLCSAGEVSHETIHQPTDDLEKALREAAGWQSHPSPNLFVVGQIRELIRNGASLDQDVIPVIRRDAPRCRSPNWNYFTSAIAQARADREAASKLNPEAKLNARTYSKPNTIADSSAILEAAIAKRTRELDALIASTEEVGNDVGSIPRLRESTA